jgi:hypothetical protein
MGLWRGFGRGKGCLFLVIHEYMNIRKEILIMNFIKGI